jgi:cysteinyl-tRNA synthetase
MRPKIGRHLMLRFYNTMTRKKEDFKPLKKGKVQMYSCGLTVYDYAHLGNLRAYMFVDLLKRWLDYRGFCVNHVMNFTDVDDKTIKGMQREGLTLEQYTQKYINAFLSDLQILNITKAQIMPKATAHIQEMVELIKVLMEKGFGYEGSDGSIYYDISKFENYGKLSKMKIEELKAGARVKVDEYGKDQASDFALWKAWDPADGKVFWETQLGKGRPGWSIECSAMSMKYLGKTLDIHTGGVDNIFPHHENEIAQSEVITGKKFVNYWLHNEHLLIKGQRMGKSLKNFQTLKDLLRMSHSPMAIRFFLLSTHYRKQFDFTFEGLEAAKNALQRLYDFLDRLEDIRGCEVGEDITELIYTVRKDFEDAMDDDLDISRALATVFNLVKEVNTRVDQKRLDQTGAEQVKNFMVKINGVLGILGDFWNRKKEELPEEVEELIKEREEARIAGDWKKADFIRDKLRKMGIILEDTPKGVKWKMEKLPT